VAAPPEALVVEQIAGLASRARPDDLTPEITRGLSLGGLVMLTGCDLSTHSGVDGALWKIMHFDDRVQARLFSPRHLAKIYPASAVTKPYRFNAFYEEWQVRETPSDWRLELSGLIGDKRP
jgi:hypothetical protein